MNTTTTDPAIAPDAGVRETARQIARRLYDEGMPCNCDLDKWQPEPSTGHSCVCRIHKATLARATQQGADDAGRSQDEEVVRG